MHPRTIKFGWSREQVAQWADTAPHSGDGSALKSSTAVCRDLHPFPFIPIHPVTPSLLGHAVRQDQALWPLLPLGVEGQMSSMARPRCEPDNMLQNILMMISSSNLVSHLGRGRKKSLGHCFLIYTNHTTSVMFSQLHVTD